MDVNYKVILGLIFFGVFAVALSGTYYFLGDKRYVVEISPNTITPETQEPANNTSTEAEILKSPNISLHIFKSKEKNVFIITWKNLPDGTTRLDVYRSKTGTNNWSLWKSVSIPSGTLTNGSIQITLQPGETTAGYSYYYAEAVDSDNKLAGGQSLWTTPPLPLTPITTLPPPLLNTAGGLPTAPPAISPTPASTPTSVAPQNGSLPPVNTTTAPSGIIYYTPQGSISGTGSPQTENFWVKIVNRAIEIGWQNLPHEADKLIVSRSQNSTGPWNEILAQQTPAYNGPYYIRVADATLDKPSYYKMEVFSLSTIIATYGPIFLTP